MGDGKIQDTMIIDGLWDIYNQYHMGVTAENVAQKYQITRQDQDTFAAARKEKQLMQLKQKNLKMKLYPSL